MLLTRCSVMCTDGTGNVQTEIRDAKDFKSISLSMAADVVVMKGESFSVEVEAQQNLLEKIKTKVNGDELKIKTDGCISSTEKILVTVHLPELEGLEVNGSGKIILPDTFVVHNIKLDVSGSGEIIGQFVAAKIESDVSGSGRITLSGSANKQKDKVSGSGIINAKNLPCNEAEIKLSGSGDAFLYVINNLDIDVSGSGNVHYKGKPVVNSHISGSGKAVDEN